MQIKIGWVYIWFKSRVPSIVNCELGLLVKL